MVFRSHGEEKSYFIANETDSSRLFLRPPILIDGVDKSYFYLG